MSEKKITHDPDDVIRELGGCGPFQVKLATTVHLINMVIVFSLHSNVFTTAPPKWHCVTDEGMAYLTNHSSPESCIIENGTTCSHFAYDPDMSTIVSEWDLVCDNAWISPAINSIQVGCMLIGNFLSGHLADTVGRKKPFFMSLLMLIVFNLLSYLSVNWVMYAVVRAFAGVATGIYLTIRYNYQSEFSLSRWRIWLIGFPSWGIEACIMALVLWILKDWRNMHLVIAIVGVPFLATWWILPESFRWFYAHDKIDKAEEVVTKVSQANGRPVPDMTYMKQLTLASLEENKKDRMYTALDLFKSRILIKVTCLLSINWFGLGLISYGIAYGIQRLAGNIYLNMFLFSLVEIPGKFVVLWLLTKIGRRTMSMILFATTTAACLIVGIVSNLDIDAKDSLRNGFALVASLCIGTAWSTIQTLTVETYPTVVRNIGFGFCSVFCRIAAAIGPQLVFLYEFRMLFAVTEISSLTFRKTSRAFWKYSKIEMFAPGILYFTCAVVAAIGVIALFFMPETRGVKLTDKLNQTIVVEEPDEPKSRAV